MWFRQWVIIKKGVHQFFLPHTIHQNTLLHRLTIILIIVTFGHLVVTGFFLQRLPNVLILHSNIYFGIDLIGSWYHALFVPLLGILISIVHYIIAVVVYQSDKFVSFFILSGAIVIQFALFTGTIFIIKLNI